MASGRSSGFRSLWIWRNLRVMNKFTKISKIPNNAATGAHRSKATNLSSEKVSPVNEAHALEAGHASAIKLKNAKAAPHSVVASAREHKDDDDDGVDGDHTDASGAN